MIQVIKLRLINNIRVFVIVMLLITFPIIIQAYDYSSATFTRNRDFILTFNNIKHVNNLSKYLLESDNKSIRYYNSNYSLERNSESGKKWRVTEISREKINNSKISDFEGSTSTATFGKNGALSYTKCLISEKHRSIVDSRNADFKWCATATKSACRALSWIGLRLEDIYETVEKCKNLGIAQSQLKKIMSSRGYKKIKSENLQHIKNSHYKLMRPKANLVNKILDTTEITDLTTPPTGNTKLKGKFSDYSDKVTLGQLAVACSKLRTLSSPQVKNTELKPALGNKGVK